jgi:hypothetical protein
MWRYVRIVENTIFEAPPPNNKQITTAECNDIFCRKTTIFGRKYKITEGVKTCFLAEQLGYIRLNYDHGKKTSRIGIRAEGIKFTSISGLLNELAGTIVNLPPVVTLAVSLVAIIVSIVALKN